MTAPISSPPVEGSGIRKPHAHEPGAVVSAWHLAAEVQTIEGADHERWGFAHDHKGSMFTIYGLLTAAMEVTGYDSEIDEDEE